ncbi:hypothetical protein CA267_013625 [Alteromonas pelagimontana]|uniref:Uncharacterized protein n=1 Tax=Alteromonas pelagimontana TaxID=1858656 RepID=A0A6M4MIB2_9ALTE|nr:hypothetical protein CA267_013625 [Alteromonas pelagimontana]
MFDQTREHHSAHPEFTEICTALYERELVYLAYYGPTHAHVLKRKLSGLPHHIKRAAYFLAHNSSPLTVDTHNGSWQAKQSARCPVNRNCDPERTEKWYSQHAAHGLVVGIRVQEMDNEHIELDSIDRVEPNNFTVHTNKHGWFTFAGNSLEKAEDSYSQVQLLKPTKTIMTAACCGHSWNHKGKISPRSLTLRELLLSTTIDWKHFNLTKIQSPAQPKS